MKKLLCSWDKYRSVTCKDVDTIEFAHFEYQSIYPMFQLLKIHKRCLAWCYRPVIPATWEAQVGGSLLKISSQGKVSETISENKKAN
jgi:hypothetical protein